MKLGNINTLIPLTRNMHAFSPIERRQSSSMLGKPETDKNIDAEKLKLKEAAQGFEAIFIRKLLSTMRSTMTENGMFGSGLSGSVYGDIIDTAVADVLARKGVLGFGDMVYSRLVKSIGADSGYLSGK